MANFAPIGPGAAEKTAPVESATDQDLPTSPPAAGPRPER